MKYGFVDIIGNMESQKTSYQISYDDFVQNLNSAYFCIQIDKPKDVNDLTDKP